MFTMRMIPRWEVGNLIFKTYPVSGYRFIRYIYKWLERLGFWGVKRLLRLKGDHKENPYLTDKELKKKLCEEIVDNKYTDVIYYGIREFLNFDNLEDIRVYKAFFMELRKPYQQYNTSSMYCRFRDKILEKFAPGFLQRSMYVTVYGSQHFNQYYCTIANVAFSPHLTEQEVFDYINEYHIVNYIEVTKIIYDTSLKHIKKFDVRAMIQNMIFFSNYHND